MLKRTLFQVVRTCFQHLRTCVI